MDKPPRFPGRVMYHRDTALPFHLYSCYPHPMNLKIIGDRSFHVQVTFEFYDTKKLWRNWLEVDDRVKVESTDGDVIGFIDFHVVGRMPSDIKQITLEYDGHTVVLDPGPDKFENLSPIILYDKGRDYWTNQLRRRAEEAGC